MTLGRELGALAEDRLHGLARLIGSRDAADPAHLVLTSVTWTEAYVDAVLRTLIAHVGSIAAPFAAAMFAELEDRIFGSWPERHAWLSKGFGVSIADRKASADLLTLIELRNALVHGSGRLTDRQSRDVAAMVALEARLRAIFLVQVERRQLHLASATGPLAIRAAQAYIQEVDAEARRLHPGAQL